MLRSMPSVHTTEIDGVPVFWQDAPGPLTAGLMFACGTRDESFLTIGVTHLVEHLVMGTLPRVHHDRNASVDLTATSFYATGRPDQVVAFLRGVCEGISAAPIDRLAQEAGVLDAEGGFATHPTASPLLNRRYGARGVGLEFYVGPGHGTIRPEAVLAHLKRFFVNGNAALWLTGPPPDDLRLPLPPGPRVARTEPAPVAQEGPRWSQEMVPSPGVLLRGRRDPAMNVAMQILHARVMDEARHRQGLSYQVFGGIIGIGPDTREYLIGADARDGEEAQVTQILWEQVTKLAAEGPTDDELEHEKAGFAEVYSDPRWPADEAAGMAESALFDLGRDSVDSRLAQVASITREDVRRCLAQATPTALIAVPPNVKVTLPGVTEGGCPRRRATPSGQPFVMKALVRLLSRQFRAPKYYLTGTGLARLDPDGDLHETTFADVIGVQVDGNDRMVFAANGCLFPIMSGAYRGSDRLVQAIDLGVKPHLRYATDGRPLVEPAAEFAKTRRRATVFRILNALGAVVFGFSSVILFANWRYNDGPIWWAIVGAVVALWCAVDAVPRSRQP